MGQRLGIAVALLGDPTVLILDEPVNGLDPEGIRWIRDLMKHLATLGKTIFVSSHLMSEMENTADHLIVIGQGRLVADESIASFIERSSERMVLVRTPQPAQLQKELERDETVSVQTAADGALIVRGLEAALIGEKAAAARVVLHELTPQRASLEEAFMALTADAVEYHAGVGEAPPAPWAAFPGEPGDRTPGAPPEVIGAPGPAGGGASDATEGRVSE
jgi:ABC-2 type transport system ATP-binding protein